MYFNNPVSTSVSAGVNAVYLNQTLDDTLIAYINRAEHTLDIAVYNYIQSGNMSNIGLAVNNAYQRGVVVRWIYNGSSSNSGLSQLNASIPRLASPTTTGFGIMHNKFMIVDANYSNALVWTGSCNWDSEQFNLDVNNVLIFQDSAFAHAYTTEFNEMWGSSGPTPNSANSKFGPFKLNNTQHSFSIGGVNVEQYFSPSDNTNDQIVNAIHSANHDLYFGVYTFTENQEADSIVSKIQNQNVHTAGIIDQYSQSFSPYSTLSPVMGNALKVYNQSASIYHSKMMIADPCDPNSDPLVETGSHNWTISADTKNDENTVIIHDSTIANVYYQSFYRNFQDLSGTLTPCSNSSGIEDFFAEQISIFPNPANEVLSVDLKENISGTASILNFLGALVKTAQLTPGVNAISIFELPNGFYLIQISTRKGIINNKLIIQN